MSKSARIVIELLCAGTVPCAVIMVGKIPGCGHVSRWLNYPAFLVASKFGTHDLSFAFALVVVDWLFYGALAFCIIHAVWGLLTPEEVAEEGGGRGKTEL